MEQKKMVRVVATGKGFDGVCVREPDEEFDMPASVFDKRERKDASGKVVGEPYAAPSWFKAAEAKGEKKDGKDLV